MRTYDAPPSLWLLRHAQPLIAPGICYGQTDVTAALKDTQQSAQALLAALPAASQDMVLRTSPLQRCDQLAQALQAQAPDTFSPIQYDPRLQEMHFGRWESRAWDDIGRQEIDTWARDLAHTAPGGGESLVQMLQRVRQALHDSWLHDSGSGQRHVLWVTHAGVIRCVQWLRQHGSSLPTSVDWSLPAPGFGQWLRLPWG